LELLGVLVRAVAMLWGASPLLLCFNYYQSIQHNLSELRQHSSIEHAGRR
jgi:hypothetical protein